MAQQTLRVTSGPAAGTTIQLNGDLVFGRDAADSGSLGGDPEISRRHARNPPGANGEAVVEDLGSTNGTFVNGQRISSPTPLRPGDSLELGGSFDHSAPPPDRTWPRILDGVDDMLRAWAGRGARLAAAPGTPEGRLPS